MESGATPKNYEEVTSDPPRRAGSVTCDKEVEALSGRKRRLQFAIARVDVGCKALMTDDLAT